MEVLAPARGDRVAANDAGARGGGFAQQHERGDVAVAVARNSEALGHRVPPVADDRGALVAVVAADDVQDAPLVVGDRGLDGEGRRARGKEALAHERVVDEKQQVGRGAPELCPRCVAGLGA